jgi:hypothetical protein
VGGIMRPVIVAIIGLGLMWLLRAGISGEN